MLLPTRRRLMADLIAYGENEASARVDAMPVEDYGRMGELGFEHSLTGMLLSKASCLAAIEVLEGRPRELKRQHRIFSDIPVSLIEPDAKLLAIQERFRLYGRGAPVGHVEIMGALSVAVGRILPDYRYYKSFAHFRRSFDHGVLYIGFERGHGSVTVRFGVRHDGIEKIKRRLYEGVPSLDHYSRTIHKWSINMGVHSPRWPHPTETSWPISGSDGLRVAGEEICAFVQEIAEPYVLEHQHPVAIRSTLLEEGGHADLVSTEIGATVFAIDHLLRRNDWLESDYQELQRQFSDYAPMCMEELKTDYDLCVAGWDLPA
jgi:hypothetical protein